MRLLDSLRGRSQLEIAAAEVRKRVDAAKASLASTGIEWYPYDSLASVWFIHRLLESAGLELADLIGREAVLDAGSGDGHISFFFESLGYAVDAVDYPYTNHNGMAGIRALKTAIHSNIGITVADIDTDFRAPRRNYGLIACLGVLYHIRNPIYLLERFARSCRYCIVSTKIANRLPDHEGSVRDIPIAYLVGPTELNNDKTNFWIFSRAGFERAVERSGFQMLAAISSVPEAISYPASGDDERLFCLLKSTREGNPFRNLDLIAGWHAPEEGGWRWTERRFSIGTGIDATPPSLVRIQFFLPAELRRDWSLTIRCSANGHALPERKYDAAGEHEYEARIPEAALSGEYLRLEFELSQAIAAGEMEGRELGIAVQATILE